MGRVSDADVDSVTGAFWSPDVEVFRVLLARTAEVPGDLAELGVLYGRSAVLIGDSLQPGETFTVIDLFDEGSSDDANARENAESYPDLAQGAFEASYLRLHPNLPTIVRGPSETIVDRAARGAHRFVHVDASHLYDHVKKDIAAARALLRPDGVVALDDFRAEHTPGVAAAVWQATATSGLRPFAVTPFKMYATWGDPSGHLIALRTWAEETGHSHEVQSVDERDLLRIWGRGAVTDQPHPAKRYVPEVAWPAMRAAREWIARARRAS